MDNLSVRICVQVNAADLAWIIDKANAKLLLILWIAKDLKNVDAQSYLVILQQISAFDYS